MALVVEGIVKRDDEESFRGRTRWKTRGERFDFLSMAVRACRCAWTLAMEEGGMGGGQVQVAGAVEVGKGEWCEIVC
jgi:hypothetical protein